jgi:hypothetical protein
MNHPPLAVAPLPLLPIAPLKHALKPAVGLLLAAACSLPALASLPAHSIVKCIDQAGRVTLTDMDCRAGARKVMLVRAVAPAPASGAPAGYRTLAATPEDTPALPIQGASMDGAPLLAPSLRAPRYHAAPRPAQRLRHLPANRPTAGLARDVATLKAARKAFKLLDEAHHGDRLAQR